MPEFAIEIRGLGKSYLKLDSKEGGKKEKFDALKDINLTIPPARAVGIVGSNGSGKSTLLKILAGIIKPNSGRAVLNGKVTSILDLGSNFHTDLSGEENTKMFLRLNTSGKEEFDSLLEKIKAFSGLEKDFYQPVKYYSNGMFLKLAFSCAFFIDADIYLFDEITNVGDESFKMKINLIFEDLLKKNKTLLIASHDSQEIARLCTDCLWLDEGNVVAYDKPTQIIPKYSRFQRLKFEGDAEVVFMDKHKHIISENDETTHFYVNLEEHNPENSLIDLKSISIYNVKGQPVFREEEIHLEFIVQKKSADASFSVMFKLRNEFNHPLVFALSVNNLKDKLQDRQFEKYTGLLRYVCTLPKMTLTSGTYFASVWLGQDISLENSLFNQRAFKLPSELSFNILHETPEFLSEPIHHSWQPALEWKTTPVPNSDKSE